MTTLSMHVSFPAHMDSALAFGINIFSTSRTLFLQILFRMAFQFYTTNKNTITKNELNKKMSSMKRNRILPVAVLGAALLGGTYFFGISQSHKAHNAILDEPRTEVVQAAYTGAVNKVPPTDFERAAQTAVPSVVHIKTLTKAKQVASRPEQNPFGNDEFFKRFFGDAFGPQIQPEQRASGSGVIVSEDGYIVTNNHVVDGASEVTITLSEGNKSFKAKVIGTDPSTDLALVKVDA